MKTIAIQTVLLLLILSCNLAVAETVVIVHPRNPVTSLDREQVMAIFLGRKQNFPGGSRALPTDLPSDSPTRSDFYRKLVDKSVAQINAYWARLLFTGRATPPKVLKTNKLVLKSVSEDMDAIAYINSAELDNGVKVVFRLK